MRKCFSVSYCMLFILGLSSAAFGQITIPTTIPTASPTPSSYTLNWGNSNQNYRSGGRHFQSSAVFNHRLWIIGGEVSNLPAADVLSSVDGLNWSAATTQAVFGGRWGQATVIYDAGQGRALWVIGGSDNKTFFNDVWQSKDGATWTEVTASAAFSQRVRENAVVFNHKIWVIGGRNSTSILNDIWSSTDGKTWALVTAAAAFPPRYSASLLVNGNSLWLMAGQGNNGPLADVWTSADGENWKNVTGTPGFTARASQSAVVYKGLMWILGGHDVTSQTVFGDAWWSSNGSQWYQATQSQDYTSRWAQSSEVFNQKIWMITGANGTQLKPVDYSDIWDGAVASNLTTPTTGFSSAFAPVLVPMKTVTPTMTVSATLTTTPVLTATVPPVNTSTITPTIGNVAAAYPNPCTGAVVSLNLPLRQPGDVKIEIFTVDSRRVRTCVFHNQVVGQDVTLNLVDNSGITLANGLYFVRVTTPSVSNILKLLVLR